MRGHGAGNPPGQGRGNPPRKFYGQSSSTALANPRDPIREPGDDINLSYLVTSMASITRPTRNHRDPTMVNYRGVGILLNILDTVKTLERKRGVSLVMLDFGFHIRLTSMNQLS